MSQKRRACSPIEGVFAKRKKGGENLKCFIGDRERGFVLEFVTMKELSTLGLIFQIQVMYKEKKEVKNVSGVSALLFCLRI